MATADLPGRPPVLDAPNPQSSQAALDTLSLSRAVQNVLSMLASLRLTVVLLGMLTFLVFVGTLAQVQHDVWYVMREGYFRVWIAWVELQTLPALLSVFKPNDFVLKGGFPFPGGYMIGTAMAINLLAAHGLRFRVTAKGGRLLGGLALLLAGVALSAVVVMKAFDPDYDTTITTMAAERIWHLLRGVLAGVGLTGAYLLTLSWNRIRRPEWFALAVLDLATVVTAVWLLLNPQWRIDDAGMRIVWQLLQALAGGGMLLAGCWFLFRKRAGVVLLHAGVAILMAHEFYTAETAVEANMMIEEGETANFIFDNRESELALIDRSGKESDRVTVIPVELLKEAADLEGDSPERVLNHPDLPVNVRVVEYFPNSNIRTVKASDSGRATLGAGSRIAADNIEPVSGVDGTINLPAAYVEFLDKDSGDSLGSMLVTDYFDPWTMSRIPPRGHLPGMPIVTGGEQRLQVGEAQYDVAMRFKRIYKSYRVKLLDFRHDVYTGTNTPKNFSSVVHFVDPEHGADFTRKIWMNNPLRYRGETFYQADWNKITGTGTLLQVVKNESWMLPYVGCATVLLGMLMHFSVALTRFLGRRMDDLKRQKRTQLDGETQESFTASAFCPAVFVPAIVALLTVFYFARQLTPPEIVVDDMPVHQFAVLPVVDEGRVKPYDTLARNMLQYLCERQEAPMLLGDKKDKRDKIKIPASQWLLEVIADRPDAHKYDIFRITNLELQHALGLPRRPGYYRYSFEELQSRSKELFEQIELVHDTPEEDWSLYQTSVIDLEQKLARYFRMVQAFQLPRSLSGDPGAEDEFTSRLEADRQLFAALQQGKTVRAVVPATAAGEWKTLFEGNIDSMLSRAEGRAGNPAALQLALLIESYRMNNAKEFEESLTTYQDAVASYERDLHAPKNAALLADMKPGEPLDSKKLRFEQRFNSASPFFQCSIFYLIALVLSAAAWLGWPQTLGRSATAIIVVTLVVHTLALAARIYISGRPPITNLYTTAIFNGWAFCILMLLLESIFKLGIGNFIASVIGFTTLIIAHNLGLDEDTFTVMQAVLDTQFWLFTHVTTINLGYTATMASGCLGIVYLVLFHLLGMQSPHGERALARMIYGTLCFAILTSFIGTVLGGLWADDSWGRFWGWDPKENGAMMIVLWNAVALHARWGKMVSTRGLAMLVVFGNIITAWSWFGVNQLGQGMHNYGFSDGLGFYLLLFFVSQMGMMVVGAVPWNGLLGRNGTTPPAQS